MRKWLSKNRGLYCICKFLRRFGNRDFREYLLSYRTEIGWRELLIADEDSFTLTVHKKGSLNNKRMIYVIPLDTVGFGMCSQFIVILNRINFAESMGMIPCVNWYDSLLYKEDEPVNGTTNIFEYYFEPIQGITVEQAEKSCYVVYDNLEKGYGFDLIYVPLATNEYEWTEQDLSRFAQLIREYIKLRPNVDKKMKNEISQLIEGKRVLGVHGRGGDMKLDFYNHPISVTGMEYADAAEEAMKKMQAEYVFLATDDQEILDSFIDRFKDKLLYHKDVVRSTGCLHNALVNADREYHHYLSGYEILRDVYTLAQCGGLVTGLSMINGVANIFNRAFGLEYEYTQIIDKGRHTDGVNVNDPGFVENDKRIAEKIKLIKAQDDIDQKEKDIRIERVMKSAYGSKSDKKTEGETHTK